MGSFCLAQHGVAAEHGTVVGHVFCADTNGPARFAQVTLQPVAMAPSTAVPHDHTNQAHEISKVIHTGLDGSFTIPNVAPGDYYLIAEKLGYRSGVQFPREEMQHPTEQTARRMAELLTPVRVVAGRTAAVETRLLRGASIAGTARFDDGTPYSAANVQLWRHDAKDEWEQFRAGLLNEYGSARTNDAGEFRMSGLPAGEYLLSTDVAIQSVTIDRAVNGDSEGWYTNMGYRLDVYAPHATRRRDAKRITLKDGEAADAVEIEVPLSKLHAVTGKIAENGTGRTVNAGKVSVVFDDGTELAYANVDADDEGFHLAFVPEGSYTLKVSDAREVVRTEVPNSPGQMPAMRTEEKIVRSFGDGSTPLVVTGEMSGVVISVPAKDAKGAQ